MLLYYPSKNTPLKPEGDAERLLDTEADYTDNLADKCTDGLDYPMIWPQLVLGILYVVKARNGVIMRKDACSSNTRQLLMHGSTNRRMSLHLDGVGFILQITESR